MASRIMNDEEFYKNKASIMKPIDEFFFMSEQRTADNVIRYERNSKYLLIGIMALIVFIMGTFVVSYIMIQRQITKRQLAEDKLKIYAQTIKSINEAVNIADLNDNLLLVNPAFSKSYGYSEDELLGRHSSIFWSEHNPKELVAEILPATLQGGWNGELFNKKKDGSEFPVHLSTAVIKDNFYIALFDPDSDLLSFPYFVDEINPPMSSKKCGRGYTEYVLRTGEAIIIDKALVDELHRAGEIKVVGAPSEVWVGVPLKISGSTIGVIVVQDYKNENVSTEKEKQILAFVAEHVAVAIYKKRVEEKLKLYSEKLLALNATKNKFFSIIAHDLKSPFFGFLGLTQEIIKNASNISAQELTQLGQTMHQAADSLFNLLQNLLEWAQMQSGSISLLQKDISLTNMIAENVKIIKNRSEQKGISIINMVTDPIHAYADEKMINSVLLNLLSNAVKFTHHNGTVTICSKKTENQMIEISIRDTGVGMTKSMVEKLFKIDEKIGRKGTEGELSTGLGLLLCKEFVEKNDGKIWAESEEGKGKHLQFNFA